MAHGKIIKCQDHALQILIILPGCVAFYKFPAFFAKLFLILSGYFRIQILDQLLYHILSEKLHLSFIPQTEIRVEIYGMKIIPDNRKAEAVNGRDLCMVDQSQLFLQVHIVRAAFYLFLNCLPDPLLHLTGSCIGKGHHQQMIDIHRRVLIANHGNDALYQYCCFSRTGCRRYQDISVSQINDLLLFLRPSYCCHLFRSPPPFSSRYPPAYIP